MSCAAILLAPEESIPKGMVLAVVPERFITAPLTVPDVTGVRLTWRVEPTSAVTASEPDDSVANATSVLSITALVPSLVVIFTKNEVFADDGLVIPV